jgi:hypothetical protein
MPAATAQNVSGVLAASTKSWVRKSLHGFQKTKLALPVQPARTLLPSVWPKKVVATRALPASTRAKLATKTKPNVTNVRQIGFRSSRNKKNASSARQDLLMQEKLFATNARPEDFS